MSPKDVADAALKVLEILWSWTTLALILMWLLRGKLQHLVLTLADRLRKAPGGWEFDEMKSDINELKDKTEKQELEIQRLLGAISTYSMSSPIFTHLCGVACLKEYNYAHRDQREWYFLRDNGYVQPARDGDDFIEFTDLPDKQNVVEVVKPTPIAWNYIQIRSDQAVEIARHWYQQNSANMNPQARHILGDELWHRIVEP